MTRLKFKKGRQNELLEKFIRVSGFTSIECAKIFNISRKTFHSWKNERTLLPESIFNIIVKKSPRLEIFKKDILEEYPENWGQSKGGKEKVKTIDDIDNYMRYVRKSKDTIRKLNKKKIETDKIVKEMMESYVDLKCILAICVLTDGSIEIKGDSYRICYYTKDENLRNIVKSLMNELSEFSIGESMDKKGVYGLRVSDRKLGNSLIKLIKNNQKIPKKGQKIDDYLKKRQPTIQFLKNTNEPTRIWSIRFAFSLDGSISSPKNGKKVLGLSCYNINLNKEWQELLRNHNIESRIGVHKASWSGTNGIRIYKFKSILNFWKMGGFLPGVKISKKSKYFKGIEKNELLKSIVMGS